MAWQRVGYASFVAFIAAALITGRPASLTKTSGGCVGGTGGVSGANGVVVDADGVLRRQTFQDPTGQLTQQRWQAAKAKLERKVAAASKLRKVSLNRLEAAIKNQLDKNLPLTEEMQYLAGLTRVKYVFYYPETKDIVLAGPAEGWMTDLSGRVTGIETGRATIELQDLVTALRAYPPTGKKTGAIVVSIDPTPEGLANMQKFLKQIGTQLSSPNDADMIVDGLRTSMGFQNIRVQGVPATTHFAQVLVEADYRMKLIGIGLEKPAVKLASYVEKANPHQANRNALQRWYFIPDYQCVRVAADELGMELVGNGVKLVGEDQVVNNDGSRGHSNKGNKASQQFVEGFTRKYPELSARTPVYAQLRNCIDLAIAAAFIQQHDYYGKAGWKMETLADEKSMPVETLNLPQRVETVVASVWKGGQLMTPVGGGVTIHPNRALETSNMLSDDEGKVGELRESIQLKDLGADQWWWD